MLLGNVSEMEELRECASDWQCLVERHPGQYIGEFAERTLVTGPAALSQGANTFDDVEHVRTDKPLHRVAKQLTKQAHIVAQRLVRIGVHFSTILHGCRPSRARSFWTGCIDGRITMPPCERAVSGPSGSRFVCSCRHCLMRSGPHIQIATCRAHPTVR